MNPDELLAWNSFGGGDFTSPYKMPTQDEMNPAGYVDSSGNSPFDFNGLAAGLKAGGSILSAFGQLEQGKEIVAADEYNANLALEQGVFDKKNLEQGEELTLSTQKAMYAKAGVTMSGSPLDTALQTATQFEMDKQISNYNAQSKANMYRYEGKIAKQKSEFGAAESLLSGGLSLASAFL